MILLFILSKNVGWIRFNTCDFHDFSRFYIFFNCTQAVHNATLCYANFPTKRSTHVCEGRGKRWYTRHVCSCVCGDWESVLVRFNKKFHQTQHISSSQENQIGAGTEVYGGQWPSASCKATPLRWCWWWWCSDLQGRRKFYVPLAQCFSIIFR